MSVVGSALDATPLAATVFAVPQFVPQLVRLAHTGDTAGVSWSWAALTCVNNAAWLGYFALSRSWTALVPATSATVLAGALGAMLARRAGMPRRAARLIAAWTVALAVTYAVAGRVGLGTALTATFVVQVAPSVWTAYGTDSPTGISRGTWLLILGELSCWAMYGLHTSDPRLTVLGCTGIVASLLMLVRTSLGHWPPRPSQPGVDRRRPLG